MKALVKTASGPAGLQLLDLPPPVPGPGQVLVAVRAAAMCGTDVHIAHGTLAVRPPLVLGHELAGVVVGLGPGVSGVSLGTRVTTETDASVCGECAHCLAGDQHRCPHRTAIGTTAPGGFAELVAVPAVGVHRLPDHVDFVTGSLTEPLAVAVRAVIERAAVVPGDVVVVIGPGTIGLLVAQVAVTLGAMVTVAGLARHRDRFRLAQELGIPHCIALDERDGRQAVADGVDGLGVDVVFECSGAPGALDEGIRHLRKGGRLIVVAFTGGLTVPLDLDHVVNHELALIASRGKRPASFASAIDLLERGRVTPRPLVTHVLPLERWEEGFEIASRSGTKVVLAIEGG